MLKIVNYLLILIGIVTLSGCSSSYKIEGGAPKATLDVSIKNLGKKTGIGSIFSGSGYRLELYSYDIAKCELKDRVVRVNPFNVDDSIDIPANEPLYLFYFYSSMNMIFKSNCAKPIAFIPKDKHKYKFDFKLKKARCAVRIIDKTDRKSKVTFVRVPKVCLKKRHAIQ